MNLDERVLISRVSLAAMIERVASRNDEGKFDETVNTLVEALGIISELDNFNKNLLTSLGEMRHKWAETQLKNSKLSAQNKELLKGL